MTELQKLAARIERIEAELATVPSVVHARHERAQIEAHQRRQTIAAIEDRDERARQIQAMDLASRIRMFREIDPIRAAQIVCEAPDQLRSQWMTWISADAADRVAIMLSDELPAHVKLTAAPGIVWESRDVITLSTVQADELRAVGFADRIREHRGEWDGAVRGHSFQPLTFGVGESHVITDRALATLREADSMLAHRIETGAVTVTVMGPIFDLNRALERRASTRQNNRTENP